MTTTLSSRLQAKEQRKKTTPTAGIGLGEISNISPTDNEELFPIAVRVVPNQNDELSKRIKGCFGDVSGLNHSNSPNTLVSRPLVDYHRSMTNHKPPPPQQPLPQPTPTQNDKTVPFSKGRDSKESKRPESSERKQKHKEKKRKSAHSEEKQSKKKSKSSDRTHSPPPIKDSSSLLPPAKKVCHRSSSVSSDRSDNSVKSRSSSDKQQAAGSRYNTHGELAKSKSAAKASTSNHSTHAAPSGSSSKTTSDSHSTKSSSNLDLGIDAATEALFGTQSLSMATSSKSSLSNTNSSKPDKDSRSINGLIRTKPTNLVIPSVNPSQAPSHQSDKEDPGIKKILEEMIKPAEKITEIQTPCKADGVSAYPFNNLPKAVERMSNQMSSSSKPVPKPVSQPRQLSQPVKVKTKEAPPTHTKPAKPPDTNGVKEDLSQAESAEGSDSESESSSDSSSSDSSNSDSSGSNSSDEEEESKPGPAPSILFPKLIPSPAPPQVNEETNDNVWNLDLYYNDGLSKNTTNSSKPTISKSQAPAVSKSTAAPPQSTHSQSAAASSMASSAAPKKKRGRGRPRKEESKKVTDPDFSLPDKIPDTVNSLVVSGKKKRNPSASSSLKSKPPDQKDSKGRGRPRKKPDSPTTEIVSRPVNSSSSLSISPPANFSSSKSTTGKTAAPPSAVNAASRPSGAASWNPAAMEEEDVDVDVVSDESADFGRSPSTSFKPIKTCLSPKKMKADSSIVEPKVNSYPKHEPISPAETTPHFFTAPSVTSLPISIPLHMLHRKPAIKPVNGLQEAVGVKGEKVSPSLHKRKQASPLSQFPQAILEAKAQAKKRKTEGEPAKYPYSFSAKNMKQSTPPSASPDYSKPVELHQSARDMKKQHALTSQKPLRYILALDTINSFMMSGIGKEMEGPRGSHSVKSYFMSTLTLAESLFSEALNDPVTTSSHPIIHLCCQVLCLQALAHLKFKCFDLAGQSHRKFDDPAKERYPAISPFSHPALPGSSPAAPSPASIASTGSITSDSGRSNSMPPVPAVPPSHIPDSHADECSDIIKHASFYFSARRDMSKSVDIIKDQFQALSFFRNLEFPAEYVLLLSAESKYFVHYIRMASAKLKSDLEMHS